MNDLSGFLEDAAHYPGGHAVGVEFPRSVEEVAQIVSSAGTVLPIGAQSSLTGGATPMGELIIATSRMTGVLERTPGTIRVQAGLTVSALQEQLASGNGWFPPAPTFTGACVGGIVATNAAGAATFKYGTTRDWVAGLTIVLADGTIVTLRRGELRASGGRLIIAGREVPIPSYRMPAVVKHSAGYFSAPDMDAVDLFVGSEGTLGVIADVTLRVAPLAPAVALALVPCTSAAQAIRITADLRSASQDTWRRRDPEGIDAAAIENMDARCIAVLHEDGADRKYNVTLPSGTEALLLVQLELPAGTTAERAFEQISSFEDDARHTSLGRFCALLAAHDRLDVTELALPGDARRAAELIGVREAVPAGVNQRVGAAQRTVDGRIAKTAADMIVPFDAYAEMEAIYRRELESRGLDYAIWGHISDGNVHPNVIPRSYDDVLAGREAILAFGREAARLGGCPLAEHGVGRNAVKQALLHQLYGDEGLAQMRAVKAALDPGWKLSPGVVFPAS